MIYYTVKGGERLQQYKFVVELKGGKIGYCCFRAEKFSDAQERIGNMVYDLERKGCYLTSMKLSVMEKERAKCL